MSRGEGVRVLNNTSAIAAAAAAAMATDNIQNVEQQKTQDVSILFSNITVLCVLRILKQVDKN